jgi:hypothetical protein
MREMFKGKMRLALGVIVLVVGGALWQPLTSNGADTSGKRVPPYALKIAGRQDESGNSWGVWLFGDRQNRSCWGTRTVHGGSRSEGVACGLEVPRRAWQLAVGSVMGHSGHEQSVFVIFTKPGAQRVRLLVEEPRSDRRSWLSIRVHTIDVSAARSAHLPHRLGYASSVVAGAVCARRISVLGRHGRPEGRGSLRCVV